jgi:large subunit ribosomal protein L19
VNLIKEIENEQVAKLSAGREIPDFQPGDTVVVNVKIIEGERTRVQAYEGVCIGRAGGGLNENFTVRKISYGEGVEAVLSARPPRQICPHRRAGGPRGRRRWGQVGGITGG